MKTMTRHFVCHAHRWSMRSLGVSLAMMLTVCAQAITPNTLDSFEADSGNWTSIAGSAEVEWSHCRRGQDSGCLRSNKGTQKTVGFQNTEQWAGDYFKSGISGIEIDLKQARPSLWTRLLAKLGIDSEPLPLRIGIRSADTCFISRSREHPILSSAVNYRISLEESNMAPVPCSAGTIGQKSYRQTLEAVSELRIIVSDRDEWEPRGGGEMIVDTIRVIANTGTQWRFIGLKDTPDADCPIAGGNWTTGHLFGVTYDPRFAHTNRRLTSELRRYCVMELTKGVEATAQETARVTRLIGRGLTLAQPDQVVVLPSSRASWTDTQHDEPPANANERHAVDFAALRGMGERFVSYAGRPDDGHQYSIRKERLQLPLIVLDTAGVTQNAANDFKPRWARSPSAHGETLARAATSLACGEGDFYNTPNFSECPMRL